MLQIYFRTLYVTYKIFGIGSVFFQQLIGESLIRIFTGFTLWLDGAIFPAYKKIQIQKPIFIIGHPRSGTTFLHKLLLEATDGAGFQAWHVLIPSLTGRMLIKPLIQHLIKKGKDVILPESTGHKVTLGEIEEEEMLFLHNYDTQFITVGLLGFDTKDHTEIERHDQQPQIKRDKSIAFLKDCFQRHMHHTQKKQIVAQTHFSTHRLKTLRAHFPDAKFIYVARSPLQTLPSYFSLLYKSIEHRWGIDHLKQEDLQRYWNRRYQASIALYKYFHDLYEKSEIDRERILVLPYEKLRNNLSETFDEIAAFAKFEVTATTRHMITDQAEAQKTYTRKHQVMTLEAFGLTKAQVEKDFDFLKAENTQKS